MMAFGSLSEDPLTMVRDALDASVIMVGGPCEPEDRQCHESGAVNPLTRDMIQCAQNPLAKDGLRTADTSAVPVPLFPPFLLNYIDPIKRNHPMYRYGGPRYTGNGWNYEWYNYDTTHRAFTMYNIDFRAIYGPTVNSALKYLINIAATRPSVIDETNYEEYVDIADSMFFIASMLNDKRCPIEKSLSSALDSVKWSENVNSKELALIRLRSRVFNTLPHWRFSETDLQKLNGHLTNIEYGFFRILRREIGMFRDKGPMVSIIEELLTELSDDHIVCYIAYQIRLVIREILFQIHIETDESNSLIFFSGLKRYLKDARIEGLFRRTGIRYIIY